MIFQTQKTQQLNSLLGLVEESRNRSAVRVDAETELEKILSSRIHGVSAAAQEKAINKITRGWRKGWEKEKDLHSLHFLILTYRLSGRGEAAEGLAKSGLNLIGQEDYSASAVYIALDYAFCCHQTSSLFKSTIKALEDALKRAVGGLPGDDGRRELVLRCYVHTFRLAREEGALSAISRLIEMKETCLGPDTFELESIDNYIDSLVNFLEPEKPRPNASFALDPKVYQVLEQQKAGAYLPVWMYQTAVNSEDSCVLITQGQPPYRVFNVWRFDSANAYETFTMLLVIYWSRAHRDGGFKYQYLVRKVQEELMQALEEANSRFPLELINPYYTPRSFVWLSGLHLYRTKKNEKEGKVATILESLMQQGIEEDIAIFSSWLGKPRKHEKDKKGIEEDLLSKLDESISYALNFHNLSIELESYARVNQVLDLEKHKRNE